MSASKSMPPGAMFEDGEEPFSGHRCLGCFEPCETVFCSKCVKGVTCPHGVKIGECEACNRDGDFAFDCAREG